MMSLCLNINVIGQVKSPTCDSVLEKCAITVDKQRDAIKAQEKVIKNQDSNIKVLKKKTEAQEEKIKETSAMALITNILVALLFLL